MSAFEDFVQLELPKRPYTETDTAQESVLVRRGPGPRQHVGVALAEGQVVAMVGGQIVGTTVASLGTGVRKAILTVTSASALWNIPHNLGSTNAIVQVVDNNGYVLLPNETRIVDANNITLTFNTVQTGVARVIFLD